MYFAIHVGLRKICLKNFLDRDSRHAVVMFFFTNNGKNIADFRIPTHWVVVSYYILFLMQEMLKARQHFQ